MAAAHKTAKGSASWLAAIIESANEAVIGKTLDGEIVSWNRGAQELFGYSAQEAVGRHVSMLCPPGRKDETPALLVRMAGGERIEHFETVRRHRDGSDVEVSLTVSPIADFTGHVIGASTIARDIGERKRMDAVRAQMVAIVELISDGVLVVDASGVIVFANPAAEVLMGRARSDLIGCEVGFPLSAGDVSDVELINPARTVVHAEMRVVEAEWDGRPCLLASLRDVTDRHRLEADLARRSTHDHLTGLANRFLLEDRLGKALARLTRGAGSVAVLLVDIDGFKTINDRFGHIAGDDVLVQTAGRIERVLRAADTAARFGGDEFVLVCEGMNTNTGAELEARLERALVAPMVLAAIEIRIGVSIGIALTDDPACTPAHIISVADKAMYDVKQRSNTDAESGVAP